MKHVLSILVLASLTACGGGGEGADPAVQSDEVPQGATCVPRVVSVILLGDSTQVGSDGSPGYKAPNRPAVALQAEMDRLYGAGSVTVSDQAVGGTTALQAPVVDADVIVTNYGINDAAPWGESKEAYRAALMTLKTTLFETPNPVPGQPSWDITGYAQTVREVAALRGIPVADVHAYVSALPNFAAYMPDAIHPNNELYLLIVHNALAPEVAKQVAPLRCL